eukprot:gb/GECH01001250.1/.p1 GENE.gb/GECH01001250.1/~~gb/GECH01001250.1/.p1  ORF type:complete len:370 (+),score=75.65 gb/GECH01001250.1/:1-1110(+)
MSNQEEKRKAFESYDFDSDEEWIKYRANLTFPPNSDEKALVHKYKQKYYKLKIDPEYEIEKMTSNSSQSTHQDRTENNREESDVEEVDDANTYTTYRNTSESPQQQQQEGNQSESNTNQTSTHQQNSNYSQNTSFNRSNILHLVFSILQDQRLFIIIHFIVLISMILSILSTFWYKMVLFMSMSSFLISLYNSHKFDVKKWTSDDNGHYLLLALFMLYNPMRWTYFLIPFGVFSAVHFSNLSNSVLRPNFPSIFAKIQPYTSQVLNNTPRLAHISARSELYNGFALILNAFSLRGVMILMFYWNFLFMRYNASYNTKMVFHEFRQTLDRLTNSPRCPSFIQNTWHRLRDQIILIQEKVVAQARAQAAQR